MLINYILDLLYILKSKFNNRSYHIQDIYVEIDINKKYPEIIKKFNELLDRLKYNSPLYKTKQNRSII